MRENDNSFIRRCFEKLLPLMVLNLFFLATCLPIVTIPAGWAGMNRACQELFSDCKGIYRKFWSSVRENLLAALLPGLLFLVCPIVLLYGAWFYYRISEGAGLLLALSCFCLVLGYLLYCVGTFAFQMLAYVELKLTAILKNAFYLTLGHPWLVLGKLLLSLALSAAVWCLLPYSLPWALLLGASLPCFAATTGVFPAINETIVKE